MSRVGDNGKPYDLDFTSRKNMILEKFISYETKSKLFEKKLDEKFDHAAYNLKPKHRFFSAHPTLNDALPNCILSGRVIVKGDIDRFEENGVVFAGENTVTKVDAVVLATGYKIQFPFLDSSVVSTKDNRIHLYKYAIPPNLKYHNLAFIGLVQPLGPIFPVAEMHCRWFAQILSGKLKLPGINQMLKDIECKNKGNEKRYVASTRHTIQVDWIPFMDELSSMFGAKPSLLKLAITDPRLFWACLNGPCLPYQYRLQGPHTWPGARDAILTCEERVYAPLNSNGIKPCQQKESFFSRKNVLLLLTVSAFCTPVEISGPNCSTRIPGSMQNNTWGYVKDVGSRLLELRECKVLEWVIDSGFSSVWKSSGVA
ncbi:flavin-containing monooxygenase 5 [Caerostris extrusa]|uniref:Flavin-containing monooxygenase n=1 Tax=Caerostris extrusa TaxID=172846 RepID=A0AAV4XTE1_CAEEX|nr:flavin-containing monooxygenase 5 [Caerostris extrusa]